MEIPKFLKIALIAVCLTMTACNTGKPSNTVVFRSSKPLPQRFESWSFEWSRPRTDQGANLTLEVLYPEGGEYYREEIPPFPSWNPEPSAKTDFSPATTANPPDPFFGRDASVRITVDKGFLIFSPDGFFTFNFYSGSGENLIESIPASMSAK